MKVIIIVGKENERKTRIMLELPDQKVIEEVKTLAKALKCAEAISSIIEKGKFIKELAEEEIAHTASDLILTDQNAYWSLL
jgi:hypothetical protein